MVAGFSMAGFFACTPARVSVLCGACAWLDAALTCACSSAAHRMPGAWDRPQTHTWGWQGAKTELHSYVHVGRLCGTKTGTITLPAYWYCTGWTHIHGPSVSLSLGIATSSSADKDLLWGCAPFLCGWQVGMEVWYKYTLVWSGLGAGSGLIFQPEQTILLCSKLFLKRISSIKKTTTAQLLKNTIVIVRVGFGWAVEIDLRVNHFSLFLPSLAWVVCRPWPFLSLKENKVVYGRGQHFKLVEFNCTNDIELTRKDRGFGGHRLHRSWLGFSLCDGTWHQNELNNRLKDYWGRAECKSKISRSFLS